MKTFRTIIVLVCLAMAGTAYAQTTTVPGQTAPPTAPQTSPVPTTPETDKKSEFNSPQTPSRPVQTPSEDTLIKGQKSSGTIMQDTLTPSSGKKKDRMSRRNRKAMAEKGDTTSTTQADSTKKP
ncbi:hypothetical protein [Dyadobacter arcticus]|uniref:Uncharacterized protein n=1 Tax=Dyadobacter arcticus TaxID=1078754 RepID=A0ABX0UEP7_9BACT|nr:hypothetical protein [Dyadobacter arcticus]NIJ51013.1 hypothetical protein [Dyadobacter arcticus]